jgi:hypothetical protein
VKLYKGIQELLPSPPPTTAQLGNSAAGGGGGVVAAPSATCVAAASHGTNSDQEVARLGRPPRAVEAQVSPLLHSSSALPRVRATYLLNGPTPRRAPPLVARCVLLHERVPGFSLLFREATDVHCSSCFCRPDSRPLLALRFFEMLGLI